MAYNIFPMNYQGIGANPYYMQAQQAQAFPQSNGGGLIWVQGEAGAKSYLVAPNTTVQLWDSEAQTIYLKSADASGMPSIKILDYVIRDNVPPQAQASASVTKTDYATHTELEELEARLMARLESLNGRPAEDGKPVV